MNAMPTAPRQNELPVRRARVLRGGPEVKEIGVRVEVVTPILGGSAETRMIDDVDIIRAATVRGHLRFWWRALYAAEHVNTSTLYARESRVWGRAATDDGGRSAVEIRIDVERLGAIDDSDIRPNDSRDGKATPGAYALWPAREEKKTNTPPAPRRVPGTQFRLTLLAAANCEAEVRNALRAWILFGGYGGRTRRGLGSSTVLNDRTSWLPARATHDAIRNLFEFDVFASPGQPSADHPLLAGAALYVGAVERDATKAWTKALDWLKDFRQGPSDQRGEGARESGKGKLQPGRPSISNWPEADKIRHIARKIKAHEPRHNATTAWPRAGFGLPIIGQFQRKARDGGPLDEPENFQLHWRSLKEGRPGEFDEHDRLASPLIVKALPLGDGAFVPCALWLNRAHPNGEVILHGVNNSQAPFDRLLADDDKPQFLALANKQTLRQAFLDWLQAKGQTAVVSP